MKKAHILKASLFLVIFLTFQVLAPRSHGNEQVIHVDASAHEKFGLYYPATYRFAIPQGAAGLVAQFRYSSSAGWTTLPEKKSSDPFNGIDAVRFDYAGGWAYVSISFSRSTDQIYLRMVDSIGKPINVTFDSIPRYYDGRKGAVTISLDDWMGYLNQSFSLATDYLTSYGLYYTTGIITADVEWNFIQNKIDEHPDNMEVASHSATHPCSAAEYAAAGYEAETAGSRDAIRNNLRFKAHPYIPVYIEPCGYSDASLVSSLTAAGYLLARQARDYFPAGSSFVPWDSVQQRYGRAAVVFDDYERPWDSSQLAATNALFDQAANSGGIYHLMNHPEKGFWYEGSYLLQHLEYIKGRNDIWYAGLGQLYLYHFLQEMRGNLSIRPVETTSPTAAFTASPLAGTAPLSVTFTDTSSGSITGWLWDFGDSTTSSLQNPVHVYTGAGSYTVKLTVTGPGGSSERVQSGYVVVSCPVPAPVANFSALPRKGTAPLSISFTDTSNGSITGWLWDFGDSTTSTARDPVHLYTRGGSYTVTLTVTGAGGSDEKSQAGYVAVKEIAPTAKFTAAPRTGAAPLTVTFTDTSTGSITGWLWDFGDSTASTEQNPVHVYDRAGSYTVKLTVTGPRGSNQKIQSRYIVVK